jgi:hypothetical protein
MRDSVDVAVAMTSARLTRGLDEAECRRRNALSANKPGLKLVQGETVTVLETFGTGEAFLVEFKKSKTANPDSCDWLGVLYPTELELRSE